MLKHTDRRNAILLAFCSCFGGYSASNVLIIVLFIPKQLSGKVAIDENVTFFYRYYLLNGQSGNADIPDVSTI